MKPHILIIGASRGIGLEFVRQYTLSGARVTATARDAVGLERIKALGAKPLKLDVADPKSVSGLAWQLDGEKLDVAIYNAGVYNTSGALQPPTQPEFDHVMHANVLGLMQTIPQVLPLVEEARGKFIAISSGMGSIGETESSFGWLYRVSKAALNMAVASAQPDYPNATMLALSPGWVQTDMGGASAPLSVQQSVGMMVATIASLSAQHRGAFLHPDGKAFSSW